MNHDPIELAEDQNNRGKVEVAAGNIGAAFTHFAEAVQLAPDYAPAYNNLAVVSSLMGDRNGMLIYVAKTLQLAPESRNFILSCGALLAEAGLAEDAREVYDGWLSANPEDGEVRERQTALAA